MRLELQIIETDGHATVNGVSAMIGGRLFILDREAGHQVVNDPDFQAVEMVKTASLEHGKPGGFRLLRQIGKRGWIMPGTQKVNDLSLTPSSVGIEFEPEVAFAVPLRDKSGI